MGARVEKKLSARQVASLSQPGRHSDGGGLYLFIDKAWRRRWIFMFSRNGKRTELGLGSPRDVSLADARALAGAMRAKLAAGENPRDARKTVEASATFGQCADEYIETKRPEWRSPVHARQWVMTLTKYAGPIRGLPVEHIGTDDVLRVLKPLWTSRPETAQRLRGRIENVLDAAKAKGLRDGENPARWRGHLSEMLPKRQKLARGHHKAMPYKDVPAFVLELRNKQALAALALEFTILTAVRSGETFGAVWPEIDLEAATWTIPAQRMKAAREHRVPLVPRAIEILQDVRKLSGGGFVFPGTKPGRPMSNMSMSMLLRRMRNDVTVHGFRSSFRDWAAETTAAPFEVCEMALAHTIGNKAEAAYRRGDLFDKRRELMTAWANHLDTTRDNIVSIQGLVG